MLGILVNNQKLPFFSLDNFVNKELLNLCREELENYVVQQINDGYEVFVGYNGSDWQDEKFQNRQRTALQHTVNYISTFCDVIPAFNVRYAPENSYYTILHQDMAPYVCSPTRALEENYKENLESSILIKLKNKDNFKLVPNIDEVNHTFHSLDFDYETYLKKLLGDKYLTEIKNTYKLHMVISNQKTMFIYDNIEDRMYDIDSSVCLFNPRDFHDTRLGSWGVSIQFPMHPHFLKQEIKNLLEL